MRVEILREESKERLRIEELECQSRVERGERESVERIKRENSVAGLKAYGGVDDDESEEKKEEMDIWMGRP